MAMQQLLLSLTRYVICNLSELYSQRHQLIYHLQVLRTAN